MNSIKTIARTGGLLYLIIIVAGIFGEVVVRNGLVVPGNAIATANNIMNSQMLWRVGIAGDLIMHVCDIPLMLILYILLRPVNKHLALLMVLFNLIQTAILVTNTLSQLQSSFLLSSAGYLKVFEPDQLAALSYLSIKTYGYGFGIGLIFFAFECLVIGYLIFRSGYFPKVLGVMMQIAGICYLVNSFSLLLAPDFAKSLFPAIMIPVFVAELSLCLWLIIKGLNIKKWEANKARAAGLI